MVYLQLTIVTLDNHRYRIELYRFDTLVWKTVTDEITLDETVTKVLRVTNNLRVVPDT